MAFLTEIDHQNFEKCLVIPIKGEIPKFKNVNLFKYNIYIEFCIGCHFEFRDKRITKFLYQKKIGIIL